MVCNVKTNVELMVSMKGDIGVIQSQNIPIPGTTALQEVRFFKLSYCCYSFKRSIFYPLAIKPYVNEVTLAWQNPSLKCC